MRKFLGITVLLFLFLCSGMSHITVYAGNQEEDQLNETVIEQLEQLDLEGLQEYVDSLGNFTNESVMERLLAYISGKELDYESMAAQLGVVFFAKVMEILPVFVCILAITLLSGLLSAIKSGTNIKTTADTMFLVTYAAALIPLVAILIECFESTIASVSQMQTQMEIIFPLMLTLMAASGGSLTAAVCRPAVAFFATNIVSVVHSVVLPIAVTVIAFSMASCLTREIKISRFTAFFKSINKWVIGICISAFGIFFTLQGMTAASYDGIMRRATKYVIGNGVPIVGGFLSGGFDLAVAGSVLIKNSLGSMGIFLMIAVIFEPLVLLVSVSLLLRLTAALTQSFGESKISDFLGETAGNLQYCTAGLLFTAFLYFLSIMLMVYASEALF